MKQLSIRQKILSGFVALSLLSAFIGGLGVYIAMRLSAQEEILHSYGINSAYVQRIIANIHQQHANSHDATMFIDEPQVRGRYTAQVEELHTELLQYFDSVEENSIYPDSVEHIRRIRDNYQNEYYPLVAQLLRALEQGETDLAGSYIQSLMTPMQELIDDINQFIDERDNRTENLSQQDQRTAKLFVYLLIALTASSFLVAVGISLYLSNRVVRPVAKMAQAAIQLADGDIDVDVTVKSHDEVGALSKAFERMVESVRTQREILVQIAEKGDFTVSVPIRSQKDVANQALDNLIKNCNFMMHEIRKTAEQVTDGAAQIAEGSQVLAVGSHQQAASIAQFTESLSTMQDKFDLYVKNAKNAQVANVEAVELLTESRQAMNEMMDAMLGIEESSNQIANIINVIEDIAFQTNILSLNAAVEAARVGVHGKGFAVVAEEVRSLSGKSSKAAKETAALIEGSFRRVKQGSEIAKAACDSLASVEQRANSSMTMVDEVAAMSMEQKKAIKEINREIGQLAELVHTNSATAQQSSAAAQEMSAQASVLRSILKYFKLNRAEKNSVLAKAVMQATQSSAPPAGDPDTGISLTATAPLPSDKY